MGFEESADSITSESLDDGRYSAGAQLQLGNALPCGGRNVTMPGRKRVGNAVTRLDHKTPAKGRKKPRRGRPKHAGDEVKARRRLLDAAESLFAERGFHGVTTRQVAEAAGVDVALIYYHFKNKSSLFDGVLERRARPLVSARRESLRTYLTRSGGAVAVDGAVAAFINPMIDLSLHGDPGWKSYFALVAQIDNTPWGAEIIHRFFDDNVHELIDVLQRALPGSPKRELYWAYNFLAGSMMLALSGTERVDRLSEGLCRARDLEAARLRLINYCAGGFVAMISAERLSGRA
jgi:AcrR family transcriptional regulator